MTTYYCEDGRTWKPVESDNTDLKALGETLLQEQAGLDSDNGYRASVEFWRNGVRTYAFARYESWSKFYDLHGEMYAYEYGDFNHVKQAADGHFGDHDVNKFSPERDWLKL